MSANIYIVKPNSLETSKESGIKRVPARAKEFLNDTYFEKYDNTTIFYDVFTVGRKIFLIGPPLLNFMPILDTCTIFESNTQKGTKVKVYTEHRDRSQLSWIDIPDNIKNVSKICFDLSPLQNGKKDYVLSVSLEDEINFNELLKDSKALMTLQLNNPLVWIQDWATFYNRIHQVDTVIIYDNGSSAYTVQEIADTVSAVEGIKNICIIQWDFKYGPQGKPWGTDAPWDSDFCQIGALQDARLRFLGNSAGMINADIDELFHPTESGINIFQTLETSGLSTLNVEGYNIEKNITSNMENELDTVPRFYHFWEKKKSAVRGVRKWITKPSRWTHAMNPTAHYIHNATYSPVKSFSIGHYYSINTGWKVADRAANIGKMDSEALVSDACMLASLIKAFPNKISVESVSNELLKFHNRQLNDTPTFVTDKITERLEKLLFITEQYVKWSKHWIWRNNVLVFEAYSENLGIVAFDIYPEKEKWTINISVRGMQYFPILTRALSEISKDIEILPNKKGYIFKTVTGTEENVILRKIARLLISTCIKLDLAAN